MKIEIFQPNNNNKDAELQKTCDTTDFQMVPSADDVLNYSSPVGQIC